MGDIGEAVFVIIALVFIVGIVVYVVIPGVIFVGLIGFVWGGGHSIYNYIQSFERNVEFEKVI